MRLRIAMDPRDRFPQLQDVWGGADEFLGSRNNSIQGGSFLPPIQYPGGQQQQQGWNDDSWMFRQQRTSDLDDRSSLSGGTISGLSERTGGPIPGLSDRAGGAISGLSERTGSGWGWIDGPQYSGNGSRQYDGNMVPSRSDSPLSGMQQRHSNYRGDTWGKFPEMGSSSSGRQPPPYDDRMAYGYLDQPQTSSSRRSGGRFLDEGGDSVGFQDDIGFPRARGNHNERYRSYESMGTDNLRHGQQSRLQDNFGNQEHSNDGKC